MPQFGALKILFGSYTRTNKLLCHWIEDSETLNTPKHPKHPKHPTIFCASLIDLEIENSNNWSLAVTEWLQHTHATRLPNMSAGVKSSWLSVEIYVWFISVSTKCVCLSNHPELKHD